jgi:hypothetical protein
MPEVVQYYVEVFSKGLAPCRAGLFFDIEERIVSDSVSLAK